MSTPNIFFTKEDHKNFAEDTKGYSKLIQLNLHKS